MNYTDVKTLYIQLSFSLILIGGLGLVLGLAWVAPVSLGAGSIGRADGIHESPSPIIPVPYVTTAYYQPLVDSSAYAPIVQVTPNVELVPVDTASQYRPLAGPVIAPMVRVTPLLPVTVTPVTFVMHPVQTGESLISIAVQYAVPIETLLAINKLKYSTPLQAGKSLLIPAHDQSFEVKIVQHQWQAGDTLLGLAAKYGSSVVSIQAANPQLQPGSPMRPGETIAVPMLLPNPNPTSTPERIATPVYHIVQAGEVPLEIAARYDIPVAILLAANDITDPHRLQVGQQLMIPTHQGVGLVQVPAVDSASDPTALPAGKELAIPVILGPQTARLAVASIPFSAIPPPPALGKLQMQMIAAVNDERAATGLPPYQTDEALAAVALDHAQDMVVRKFAAHTNPDGQSPRDRIEASGIEGIKRIAENIQLNTWPADRTVAAAINWFMNSRPHRLNILNPYFTHVGVAAVQGPPGWYTFVLEFAEK